MVDVVTAARGLKARFRLPPGKRVPLLVRAGAAEAAALSTMRDRVLRLARLDSLDLLGADDAPPREAVSEVVRGVEVILPLAGLVDVGAERERLAKEIAKVEKEVGGIEKKLENPGFRAKAPADVIAKDEARVVELRESLAVLRSTLERLQG